MKLFCLLSLVLVSFTTFSQETVKVRPSPLAIASARYKDTYLKITYSQPQKLGREIFGKLVPYDEVWRLGANEATEITITRDMKINGSDITAGSYTIFTIPKKDSWTIILNSDVGLWGSYNYNPKADILKFDIPIIPLTDVVYEAFTIWIDQKNEKAELSMAWDKTRITFPIQFLEPKP